jgi:hypothetical protein
MPKELTNKQKARKVFSMMERRDTFNFPSASSPGKFYQVIVKGDGTMSCNCRGWCIKKPWTDNRFCTHTQQVEEMLAEDNH